MKEKITSSIISLVLTAGTFSGCASLGEKLDEWAYQQDKTTVQQNQQEERDFFQRNIHDGQVAYLNKE